MSAGSVPPAASVVLDYLRAQAEVMAERADDVRTDTPDAVHRSRVATRRARSALRTFASLFSAKRVRLLRTELAWHADQLGAPRDAEVLAERLQGLLDQLPAGQVTLPARARLTDNLTQVHATGHRALVASMDSPRYTDLREQFDRFLAEPPIRSSQADAGLDVLASLLARCVTRVRRKEARAAASGDDPHRWHEVRKAAKAARYCSEALLPAFGQPARQLAQAWEQVTEALGELQDTVVAEAYLGTEAARAREARESADTFLAMISAELRLRDDALERGRTALQQALALPPLS
ncbi:CHAD domain-containing protein [Micropruina sonneratiae]|uniref:CHAD domain-containing protein n=1 Tax=Micropruina sonneratiae TaxID=2986940 RepID=UPI0022260DDA|nr:CHAD domain-containing protein [Micropruina sp. KQZ13P-5]MCW3157607.1 CHAD domain-containing protein [Micropruina sp. KQZ13P-5]